MDLALNNLQRLICHKTQPTNQPNLPNLDILSLILFFIMKQAAFFFLGTEQYLNNRHYLACF